MKKITAIFFILLANIIIVAHAVVPHHHLPKQVFVITEHNDEDINGHKHHTDEHNHEHGATNDYDYCLLKQVITTPANSSKQEFSSLAIDFTFGNVLAILLKNDIA